MFTRHDFPILWKQVQPYRAYIPSLPVLSAGVIAIAGAALLFALPEGAAESDTASATPSVAAQAASDESGCDKQTWPYVDQRCAQRAEAARGSRQVRIVTDRGNVATAVTPLPIVEAKPVPAPKPVVAQAERPIGPTAAPAPPAGEPPAQDVAMAPPPAPAPQKSAPQAAPAPQVQATVAKATPAPQVQATATKAAPAPQVQATVTKAAAVPEATVTQPPPQTAEAEPAAASPEVTNAIAMESPAPAKTHSVSIGPSQASAAPMSPGVDALDETSVKKLKAAKAAEKREAKRDGKRELRRQKAIEQDDGSVPEEVLATVRALPSNAPSRGRARNNAVPDEVLAAVEEAAARDRGGRGGDRRGRRTIVLDREGGGQVVTVDSPNADGRRMYIVPRERSGY